MVFMPLSLVIISQAGPVPVNSDQAICLKTSFFYTCQQALLLLYGGTGEWL